MTTLIDLTQVTFHDSTLIAASHDGPNIVLTIKYFDEDDVERTALATISGVETTTKDNVHIQAFTMEGSDGEIYDLTQQAQEVLLVVYWDDPRTTSRQPYSYRMLGSDIHLQAENK